MSRSRVAWNTSVGFAAQIIILFLGFVTTPVMLHALGETSFGAFALIGSLTSYIGLLDLGIGASLIRHMSFYQERGDVVRLQEVATFGVLFYLTLALFFLPIIILLAPSIGRFLALSDDLLSQFTGLLSLVFCVFVGASMSAVLTARLASVQRLDLVSGANASGSILYTILVLLFVQQYPTLQLIFWCTGAQVIFSALLMYLAVRRLAGRLLISPSRLRFSSLKEALSFGIWSQLSNVTAVANLEADKAIISREIGVASVAPYQVANRLALLNRVLPLQIMGSLLPDVTARVSRGITASDLSRLYSSYSRTLMSSTLVISGFIASAADAMLRLWLGKEIVGAENLCIALIISYAVNNATGIGTTIFKAQGKPKYETYYGSVAAGFNVLLTVILIRPFGLNGVVAGTILGSLVGSIFFLFLFHKINRLLWWPTMGRWLSRLCLMTLVAALCSHYLLKEMVDSATTRAELLVALALAGSVYLAVFGVAGRLLSFWTSDDYVFAIDSLRAVRSRMLTVK